MLKPRIKFYETRTFGEKFSATFDFLQENWRVLLRFSLYLLLPLSLLQAVGLNAYVSSMAGSALPMPRMGSDIDPIGFGRMLAALGCLSVSGILAAIFSSALVYGLMRLYGERPDRLDGLTMEAFRPLLWRNVKRSLWALLAVIGCAVVGLMVTVLSALVALPLFFVVYVAFLALLVPLALFAPCYLMDDLPLSEALRRSYRYGLKTYGGILALGLVVGLVVYLVLIAFTIPWYVTMFLQLIFNAGTADGLTFVNDVWFKFLSYLLAIVQSFGSYLAACVMLVAMGYQYGHAAEKIDGVSVQQDVEHFEELADKKSEDIPSSGENDIDNFEHL